MLLAAPPSPLPSTVFTPSRPAHTRHKPKLSLQISSLAIAPSQSSALRTPNSALSPTSRNTAMNRLLSAPSPPLSASSTSSSSSSEDSDDAPQLSPGVKRLRRSSRRCVMQQRKKMSAHQPSTPSASFMPQPRGRDRKRAKRVGFVDEVTVHVIPAEETEDAEERRKEIERLRQWVDEQGRNSPGGLSEEEGKEWVRKLVELEMGDVEMS